MIRSWKAGSQAAPHTVVICRNVSLTLLPAGASSLNVWRESKLALLDYPFSFFSGTNPFLRVSKKSSSHVCVQFQTDMSDIYLSWIAADAFHSTVSLTNDAPCPNTKRCHSSLFDSLNTSQHICVSSVYMQIWSRKINSLDLKVTFSVIGKQSELGLLVGW